jgi:glycosyltransferase involved in cell wall biosynthesis
MRHDVKVSILINNHNYQQYVAAAIQSALNQTYSAVEVIVVDDGSTDGSRDVIAQFSDRVKTILKENGGQASAFNEGFAASQGDVICLLDSDDTFLPTKVEAVVGAFLKCPEARWCFHPVDFLSQDGQESWRDLRSGIILTGQRDFRSSLAAGYSKYSPPATSGTSFSRDLLEKIFPMPTSHGVAINDNYLKFAALALAPGYILNRSLAFQRIHSNNAYTFRVDKPEVRARSKVLTAYWLRKNFPHIHKFADKLMAAGIAQFLSSRKREPESSAFARSYVKEIPPLQQFALGSRALYYAGRSLLRRRSAVA